MKKGPVRYTLYQTRDSTKKIPFEPVVKQFIKAEGLVMYGGRAINFYLPKNKQIKTTDFDVFSSTPKTSANQLVKLLGSGQVKAAEHPGTWKVFYDGVNVADFSKPEQCIPIINKLGYRVPTLRWLYAQLNVVLSNPEHAWRWEKDLKRLKTLDRYSIGNKYFLSKRCIKPSLNSTLKS